MTQLFIAPRTTLEDMADRVLADVYRDARDRKGQAWPFLIVTRAGTRFYATDLAQAFAFVAGLTEAS